MAVHVGIGSWADDAYEGVLYPEGLPARSRLSEYARHFDHVEVNSSYYATPKAPAARSWVEQTPSGFTFSLKLHRAFSQSPARAAERGELVPRLLAGVEPLVAAGRLKAFLLVLPPTFEPGKHRLEELDTLVKQLAPHLLAVELRHRDWVSRPRRDSTLAFFRERGLAWVAVDLPRLADSTVMPVVDEVTHPGLGYLRLHGRNPAFLAAKTAAEGHHYSYTARQIGALASRVKALEARATDVFVIANNHAEDFAPKTALALKKRLLSGG